MANGSVEELLPPGKLRLRKEPSVNPVPFLVEVFAVNQPPLQKLEEPQLSVALSFLIPQATPKSPYMQMTFSKLLLPNVPITLPTALCLLT